MNRNNQHMIPEIIKDLGKKIIESKKYSNERMIMRERIIVIKEFCEKILESSK